MVATVPQIVPKPAVRSRQGNRAFTLGTRSAATETRTITYDATQGVRISRDPIGEAWFEISRMSIRTNDKIDNKLSRFLSAGYQDMDCYAYVKNAPVSSVDSYGLQDGPTTDPACVQKAEDAYETCENNAQRSFDHTMVQAAIACALLWEAYPICIGGALIGAALILKDDEAACDDQLKKDLANCCVPTVIIDGKRS